MAAHLLSKLKGITSKKRDRLARQRSAAWPFRAHSSPIDHAAWLSGNSNPIISSFAKIRLGEHGSDLQLGLLGRIGALKPCSVANSNPINSSFAKIGLGEHGSDLQLGPLGRIGAPSAVRHG